MPEDRNQNRKDDSPEVLIVSPPDYPYEEKNISGEKKKTGGLGNIVDSILDRVKGILSRFLGREVKNDDLLLLSLILLLFFEKRNKEKKPDDDLEILLMVLLYLFLS